MRAAQTEKKREGVGETKLKSQIAGQTTVHKVADKIQKLHGRINQSLASYVAMFAILINNI